MGMGRGAGADAQMQQALRELLTRGREWLRGTQAWIAQLPKALRYPSLEALQPSLAAALRELAREHARIDLELLLETGTGWQHPAQALLRPRAPYATLAELSAERLAETRDEAECQRLQHVHDRLALAAAIEASARARRLARACVPLLSELATAEDQSSGARQP